MSCEGRMHTIGRECLRWHEEEQKAPTNWALETRFPLSWRRVRWCLSLWECAQQKRHRSAVPAKHRKPTEEVSYKLSLKKDWGLLSHQIIDTSSWRHSSCSRTKPCLIVALDASWVLLQEEAKERLLHASLAPPWVTTLSQSGQWTCAPHWIFVRHANAKREGDIKVCTRQKPNNNHKTKAFPKYLWAPSQKAQGWTKREGKEGKTTPTTFGIRQLVAFTKGMLPLDHCSSKGSWLGSIVQQDRENFWGSVPSCRESLTTVCECKALPTKLGGSEKDIWLRFCPSSPPFTTSPENGLWSTDDHQRKKQNFGFRQRSEKLRKNR